MHFIITTLHYMRRLEIRCIFQFNQAHLGIECMIHKLFLFYLMNDLFELSGISQELLRGITLSIEIRQTVVKLNLTLGITNAPCMVLQ